jgi:tRNA A-37 threonylcarbamoyl transferase component Bud32
MDYNSKDQHRHKSFNRFFLCRHEYYTSEMASFLDNPEKMLDDPVTQYLKKGRTSTVARVVIDGRPLVVKRYNIKGFLHGLRRAFMVTRAQHSWQNAMRLREMGILTPEPVGFMERRFGPLRNTAYFISEYVEGPRAINYFKGADHGEMEEVAGEIAEIFNKLKSGKISHGDMKATNIIIDNGKPSLVDLDAMRSHTSRMCFMRAHRKDIRRFFKNWEAVPQAASLFEESFRKKRGQ